MNTFISLIAMTSLTSTLAFAGTVNFDERAE